MTTPFLGKIELTNLEEVTNSVGTPVASYIELGAGVHYVPSSYPELVALLGVLVDTIPTVNIGIDRVILYNSLHERDTEDTGSVAVRITSVSLRDTVHNIIEEDTNNIAVAVTAMSLEMTLHNATEEDTNNIGVSITEVTLRLSLHSTEEEDINSVAVAITAGTLTQEVYRVTLEI